MTEKMHANDRAIQLGCKQIRQVVNMTGVSLQTLNNWFNNPKKRVLFDIVCYGVASIAKELQEEDRILEQQKKRESIAYLSKRLAKPTDCDHVEIYLPEDK